MSDSVAVVWDDALLGYTMGGDHPLHPVRLDLTMRLADSLGVLAGRPARGAHARRRPTSTCSPSCTTRPTSRRSAGRRRTPTVGHGLGTADNPIFEGMYDAAALITGGSVLAARAGAQRARRSTRSTSPAACTTPCATRASGFCVFNDAAVAIAWLLAPGLRADRLRRPRRAPRRRRAGRLLRRPAGADGQRPPDPAHPVPGHRLPRGDRRPGEGAGQRGQPGPAQRHRRLRLAARLHRRRPERAARLPAADPGHPVRLRRPPRGPARRPRAHRRRPARRYRAMHDLAHEICDGRWIAARRRRVRAGALRAPGLDPPARRGRAATGWTRPPRSRSRWRDDVDAAGCAPARRRT